MLRRTLCCACVPVALAAVLSGCGPGGPRAVWLMDEPSGPTMVDSVGDHDGTATNVTFDQAGFQGRAYRFNGTDSVVRVPHSPDLNPGSATFSFSARVKFTTLPPPETWDVVRKGVSGSSGGNYKLELFSGNGGARARCSWKDGDGTSITAVRGAGLSDGAWHHLVCTRQGSQVQITVDGSSSSNTQSALGSIANTSELTVGAKPTGGDAFLGTMDDVRVSIG